MAKKVIVDGFPLRQRTHWTLEQLIAAAQPYRTRGEMFHKDYKLYMRAYSRGLMGPVCAHMAPSRKQKKHTISVPNPMSVIAPVFKCKDLKEFRTKYESNYDAGMRFGFDYQEIFENKDNVGYLQKLIMESSQDIVAALPKENADG